MNSPWTYPLPRERNLILASLLILALAAWALLVWQAGETGHSAASEGSMGSDEPMSRPPMGLTMGMAAPLFLAMWIVMMVAMMFPTAAPMILMFARIHSTKREHGQAFVPTWVFVSGYLLVWTLFGVVAYGVATAAQLMAPAAPWLVENAARFGGAVLIIAGLYQLSPLKRACLSKCRTPMEFVLLSWRDGYRGALRMGLQHGAYCLGCCWLLMVILFPLGIMNVAAMALVTAYIFGEKSLPWGPSIGRLAAGLLLAFGVLVLAFPGALLTMIG